MAITIVDYGRGNLHSVAKAMELGGRTVEIAQDAEKIARAGALVLPGVGAFGDGMRALTRLGLVDPICAHIRAKKPFLGICLGLQFLFDSSEESPGVAGLGIFQGQVKRFVSQSPKEKIPHMGWNTLHLSQAKHPMFEGVKENAAVYFVHSYYVVPKNSALVAATSTYITPFCAAIARDRLFACQFHPEKSHGVGLALLANFINWSLP